LQYKGNLTFWLMFLTRQVTSSNPGSVAAAVMSVLSCITSSPNVVIVISFSREKQTQKWRVK